MVGSDGQLDLEFTIAHTRPPADLGLGSDTRKIGLGVEWIRAYQMSQAECAELGRHRMARAEQVQELDRKDAATIGSMTGPRQLRVQGNRGRQLWRNLARSLTSLFWSRDA